MGCSQANMSKIVTLVSRRSTTNANNDFSISELLQLKSSWSSITLKKDFAVTLFTQ
jgi:hypothetical protein